MRTVKIKGEWVDIAGPGILPCVKVLRMFRRVYFDTTGKCTLLEFMSEDMTKETFCSFLQQIVYLCRKWDEIGIDCRAISWKLTDVYVTEGERLQFLCLPVDLKAGNKDIRQFFRQFCQRVNISLLEKGEWMEEFQRRLLQQSYFTLCILESYLEAIGVTEQQAGGETLPLGGGAVGNFPLVH